MRFLSSKPNIIFLCLLWIFSSAWAFIPDRPNPPRLVNNLSKEFPQFLTPQEVQALESKLVDFDKKTSNQICLVIVDDFGGTDENDFATRLGQSWGVGGAKFDNGIVVLVKPTQADGGRKMYITAGYGLESVLPDVLLKKIVSEELKPYFKQERYYEGLDHTTDLLIKISQGEFNYAKKEEHSLWPIIIFISLFILFIYLSSKSNSRYRGYTYGRGGVLDDIGGGSVFRGSGWGGFGGFGGGFGGGGGGGFGGFGGGGFGGGGAGSSW